MRNKTFLASHLQIATKGLMPTKIKAEFTSEIKDNPRAILVCSAAYLKFQPTKTEPLSMSSFTHY